MTSARFLVMGRVQGVAFRASTCREALAHGLRGYARNLADGRVEVVAEGDEAAVQALAAWLAHGPPRARVDAVQRLDALDAAVPDGFIIA